MTEQEIKRGGRGPQKRRPKLKDEERAALRADMAKSYVDDELTLRAVAELHNVSYGHARQLLLDEGVVLRSKRGTRPAAAKRVWKP